MFARFSTVAGERGAADAERDIRGFALKFYTLFPWKNYKFNPKISFLFRYHNLIIFEWYFLLKSDLAFSIKNILYIFDRNRNSKSKYIKWANW